MYSVWMLVTVINLHCISLTYGSANRTIQIQESIPITITHSSNNQPPDSSPQSLSSVEEQSQVSTQHEQQASFSNQSLDNLQNHEYSSEQFSNNPNQQDITMKELNSFRLEYYKFRLLSRIGIETDPARMTPVIERKFREKLITSTASTDQSNQPSVSISEAMIETFINLNKHHVYQALISKILLHDLITTQMRYKRSLTCDQVKSNKDACCLENFYVNFTAIGWDKWILYPAGYHANYCRGQCDLSHARYYHSTLLSKYSNIISLCCSPKQMAPLRLLYIDEENKVHQKSIPDMVVESCDCA